MDALIMAVLADYIAEHLAAAGNRISALRCRVERLLGACLAAELHYQPDQGRYRDEGQTNKQQHEYPQFGQLTHPTPHRNGTEATTS
jgi:hypothetical protein